MLTITCKVCGAEVEGLMDYENHARTHDLFVIVYPSGAEGPTASRGDIDRFTALYGAPKTRAATDAERVAYEAEERRIAAL